MRTMQEDTALCCPSQSTIMSTTIIRRSIRPLRSTQAILKLRPMENSSIGTTVPATSSRLRDRPSMWVLNLDFQCQSFVRSTTWGGTPVFCSLLAVLAMETISTEVSSVRTIYPQISSVVYRVPRPRHVREGGKEPRRRRT